MKMRNGRLIRRRKNPRDPPALSQVFNLRENWRGRVSPARSIGEEEEDEGSGGAQRGARARRVRISPRHGGRAVNKFAIFPRTRSALPITPAPATISRGTDFLHFFSLLPLFLSPRRCTHTRSERLPRDSGKGTAGHDYTDNKLTRTTLSRRIIHHGGVTCARDPSIRAARPPGPIWPVLHINRVKL